MKRTICLAVLTLAGVFATMATNQARQERASLTAHTIADNLFMLANAPSVQRTLIRPNQQVIGLVDIAKPDDTLANYHGIGW